MNKKQGKTPHKVAVGMKRIVVVGAALGLACAAGTATAVAATPTAHVAAKAAPAGGGDGEHFQCGNGLLPILNFCN